MTGRFAEHAPVDVLIARSQRLHDLERSVTSASFLIACDQQCEAARVIGVFLEEALERVDFYADNGYIQIKLYSSIDPGWVEDIAERTHARGMRLSGHIPAFMSAEQAVRAGYDEIQHINMVFLNFLAGDREDTRKQLRFTLYGDEAGKLDLDSQEVEDFIALLREQNVTIDPTAARPTQRTTCQGAANWLPRRSSTAFPWSRLVRIGPA